MHRHVRLAFENGVFPFVFDWYKGVNVIAFSNPGAALEHALIGFDVSGTMSRIHMHRFTHLSSPEGSKTESKVSVISCDSVCHHFICQLENGNIQCTLTQKPVSLMKFPSGDSLLYESRSESVRRKLPPLPRRVCMTIGSSGCMNMLAVGVHLGNLQTFLNEGEA
jgi:hypothetical protein